MTKWAWLVVVVTVVSSVSGGEWDDLPTAPGKQLLVHLFEWKWTDVAKECEDFLQHYGFGAVQVSPPNEHITMEQNGDRPWWIRYQPVSFTLQSRSGTRDQFRDMVKRCNKVGIRIVVDTVINHMVGVGQKYDVGGRGSTANHAFDGTDGVETFPAVPYDASHFNDRQCHRDISSSDYGGNAKAVRNCRLVGLLDLDQGNQHVRDKIVDYMNDLIELGVAGFRVDATKHMWPNDLCSIYRRLKTLDSSVYGAQKKPFIVGEVIDLGGEAISAGEYTKCGRVTNFKYGSDLSAAVRRVKNFKYLGNFGPGWAYWPDNDVIVFVDDHDNQRTGSGSVLTFKEREKYVMAVSFMLAWPYGVPRVMSSYSFKNTNQGPPSSGSPNFYTRSPKFTTQKTCDASSGWVCEHRWPEIRRMSQFRTVCSGKKASEIVTNEDHRLAFARTSAGFFAVNNNDAVWKRKFQTTLSPGTYCDVINGEAVGNGCSGASVHVEKGGFALISVPAHRTLAIHQGSRLNVY